MSGTSPVSFTRSSSGDIVDATKLNWPIGTEVLAERGAGEHQIHDQRATRSTRAPDRPSRAAAPRDRTARSRTARRRRARSPIHLVRSQRGKREPRRPTRRPASRTSTNGQPVQNRLPAASSADDQQAAVVHPREDRREVGRIDARRRARPSQTTSSGERRSRTSWNAVRAWRHRRKRPDDGPAERTSMRRPPGATRRCTGTVGRFARQAETGGNTSRSPSG